MNQPSAFVRRGQELIQQLLNANDEHERAAIDAEIREHVLEGIRPQTKDPKMAQAGRDE